MSCPSNLQSHASIRSQWLHLAAQAEWVCNRDWSPMSRSEKQREIARGCRTLFRRSWRHKALSIQSGRYHEFSRPVIERQGRPFSLICIANGRMAGLWWTSINSGNSRVCESVPVGSNWMRTHLWYRLEGP